ncbi:unnamed protein product [Cunninghamella echinulata]
MTMKKELMFPVYQHLFQLEQSLYENEEKVNNGGEERIMPSNVVVKEKVIDIKLEQTLEGQPKKSTLLLKTTYPIFPENGNNPNQLLPTLIYIHGGGYTSGDYTRYEKFIKDISVKAKINVIFIDYHLSPGSKFPVPVEECYSSVLWIYQHGKELNVNTEKIFIGGDSAGGNLTAATVILLKQRSVEQQILSGQVLIYPGVARQRKEYESYHLYGGGDYPYTREEMKQHHTAYLGEDYEQEDHPTFNDIRRAPLIATPTQLKGLPKTLILTAECDIVRDEGEAYARKLAQVGVEINAIRLLGTPHSFITEHVETPQYKQTINVISCFLNE